MQTFPSVLTRGKIDRQMFDAEILSQNQPVLLKGQVANWPIVAASQTSDETAAGYLNRLDIGRLLKVSILPAKYNGRYFYTQDMRNLNFRNMSEKLPLILEWLLKHRGGHGGDRVYLQALPVDEALPQFSVQNPFDLANNRASANLWIGNEIRVQTHFDLSYNLACLVAGRRRFTLFPPEQFANLYPGPFDFSPGGVPVSMASLEEPDFERFPRLREALRHGLQADLEPGDVLYIPYMWWHHVQSRGDFNILANYWWSDTEAPAYPPMVALTAALLALRPLPVDQRNAWRNILDYYIYETNGDPVAHLPEFSHGMFSKSTPAHLARLKVQFEAIILKGKGPKAGPSS